MAIRIINGGNSATEFAPSFDERIIESIPEMDAVSFVMDVENNQPTFKRLRTDEDVSDYIAELLNRDEISEIKMDESNRDILIFLRELGQDPVDVGEIPNAVPELIVL